MNKEIWKPVKGYEDLYEVSNHGDVRNKNSGRILAKDLTHNGYHRVTLSKNGKLKHFKVHRLVGQAFIQNPKNLPQINHKNWDKTDNRVENLEWCDAKYNCNHKKPKKLGQELVITVRIEVK